MVGSLSAVTQFAYFISGIAMNPYQPSAEPIEPAQTKKGSPFPWDLFISAGYSGMAVYASRYELLPLTCAMLTAMAVIYFGMFVSKQIDQHYNVINIATSGDVKVNREA